MPAKLKVALILVSLILVPAACQPTGCAMPTPQPPPSVTPTHTDSPLPPPTSTPFVPELTLEVVGQVGGHAQAVTVENNLAYLAVGPQVLIVDVSDPGAPRQIRQTGILGARVEDVAVAEGRLYIATGEAGVHILDVTQPTDPREVAFVPFEFAAHRISLHDDVALVAGSRGDYEDRQEILSLLDVSDPTLPREITRLEGRLVNAEEDYVYVDQDDALQVKPGAVVQVKYDPTSRAVALLDILRSVFGIGTTTIGALHEMGYRTLGDLEGVTEEALPAVPGVGAATAEAILEFLASPAVEVRSSTRDASSNRGPTRSCWPAKGAITPSTPTRCVNSPRCSRDKRPAA